MKTNILKKLITVIVLIFSFYNCYAQDTPYIIVLQTDSELTQFDFYCQKVIDEEQIKKMLFAS